MRKGKQHWFCFSFQGPENGRGMGFACTYVGYLQRNVTMAMVTEQKSKCGLDANCVLLSVSYLGEMTREEFTGDDP